MQICDLAGSGKRPEVDAHVLEEWGSPMIVSRGRLSDTRKSPGLVLLQDGRLQGGLLYEIREDEMEVVVLFSLAQGRGVGSALMDAASKRARDMGLRRLWLITTNDNLHAIAFYQKRMKLKAAHIDAMEESRRLKPQIPPLGEDGIPILHEFEFEILL